MFVVGAATRTRKAGLNLARQLHASATRERCSTQHAWLQWAKDPINAKSALRWVLSLESDGLSGEDSTDDPDLQSVYQFENIHVGMPYKEGRVLKIYPGSDKVTIQIQRDTSCEIQHMKLLRVRKHITEYQCFPKSQNLEAMD